MKLSYQGNFKTQEECDDIEEKFAHVMEKIVTKMTKIEYEANIKIGIEQANQVLTPFKSIL
jgi:hypothetical protein